MTSLTIRQETPSDYDSVLQLIIQAFADMEFSDNEEQYLVERLRKSDNFIPELSLVAISDDKIVGHILLTPIKIKNGIKSFSSLILAPVSVLPDFQGKGIGSQLIEAAHNKAKELGYRSVVLIGPPFFYHRFGYRKASDFKITFPFETPDNCCYAVELVPDGLSNVSGMVEFPPEFI